MSVVPQSDVLGTVAQGMECQVKMGRNKYLGKIWAIGMCKIATFYNFLFTGEKEEMDQSDSFDEEDGSDEELLVDELPIPMQKTMKQKKEKSPSRRVYHRPTG